MNMIELKARAGEGAPAQVKTFRFQDRIFSVKTVADGVEVLRQRGEFTSFIILPKAIAAAVGEAIVMFADSGR